MKLRNLIKLVGIIVLAWPIQAHAQPSVGTRRIGVLTYLEENDPQSKIYLDAFVQTLQKLGWTVGRDLRIDYRWTGGDAERRKADRIDDPTECAGDGRHGDKVRRGASVKCRVTSRSRQRVAYEEKIHRFYC